MMDYLKTLNLKNPHPSNIISPEEQKPLEEFKNRVSHIYPLPDTKLLTWLRARNLNIDKAEQMLHRHLIWRRNNEIGKLILWESPRSFLPYFHSGFDQEGTPIFILPIGQWDLKGCIEMGDMVPALKFIYQTLETLVSAGILLNIHQGIVICDFEGFSYSQIAHRTVIQGMIETVRVFEANYPEILKAAYVINAPLIFNIVYSLIKPLLNSRTLSKIQIFKSDPIKWKSVLLESGIDKSQLPPNWGGNRQGIDEYCSESWLSEPLPPYYFRKSGVYFDDYGIEWYTIKIASGEILKFPYTVSNNSDTKNYPTLSWKFWTEGHGTELNFEIGQQETSIQLIYKKKLITSESKKEIGSIQLTNHGKWILKFDNYGNPKAKVLHYNLSFSGGRRLEENL